MLTGAFRFKQLQQNFSSLSHFTKISLRKIVKRVTIPVMISHYENTPMQNTVYFPLNMKSDTFSVKTFDIFSLCFKTLIVGTR